MVGKYEIDYNYLGLEAQTALEVIPSSAHIGAHNGSFSVGTPFDPKRLLIVQQIMMDSPFLIVR